MIYVCILSPRSLPLGYYFTFLLINNFHPSCQFFRHYVFPQCLPSSLKGLLHIYSLSSELLLPILLSVLGWMPLYCWLLLLRQPLHIQRRICMEMKVHVTTWHVFMSHALVTYPAFQVQTHSLHSKTNLFQRQLIPGHDNAVKQKNEDLAVLRDRAVISKAWVCVSDSCRSIYDFLSYLYF